MYAEMYDVIMNTDPMALTAVGGVVTVFVVTIGLFLFIMSRGSGKKSQESQ